MGWAILGVCVGGILGFLGVYLLETLISKRRSRRKIKEEEWTTEGMASFVKSYLMTMEPGIEWRVDAIPGTDEMLVTSEPKWGGTIPPLPKESYQTSIDISLPEVRVLGIEGTARTFLPFAREAYGIGKSFTEDERITFLGELAQRLAK